MADANPSSPVFILSAPSPNQYWECGLGPLENYQGLQSWLGWDAQLKAFGAMLRQLGYRVLVTPAPEMFFTPTTLQVLAKGAGLAAEHLVTAVHIRFGGARFGRVLRGVPNFIATGERAWTNVLAPGAHPFRGYNTAPHAMRALLDLSGEAGPMQRPDGSVIDVIEAPGAAMTADLQKLDAADQAGPLRTGDFAGLELATLAEFSAEPWRRGVALPPSAQLRRFILGFNGLGGRLSKPMILLPWNLANPANCVVDLVAKVRRAASGTEAEAYILLLPYNAEREITEALGPPLAELRRQLAVIVPEHADSVLSNLFIGRITDLAALTVLRRLRAVAWLDGLDPEAAWARARWAASGIRTITLGETRLALDEPAPRERRDAFGQQFFAGKTLPVSSVDRLLADTVAATQGVPLALAKRARPREEGAEFGHKILAYAV